MLNTDESTATALTPPVTADDVFGGLHVRSLFDDPGLRGSLGESPKQPATTIDRPANIRQLLDHAAA